MTSPKPFRLFGGSIHAALVHAATDFDRREEKRASRRRDGRFNPYALAQYLQRIEEAESDIARGATPRAALLAAFNDRFLDCMLTAIGEPKAAAGEKTHGRVMYEPVTKESGE